MGIKMRNMYKNEKYTTQHPRHSLQKESTPVMQKQPLILIA